MFGGGKMKFSRVASLFLAAALTVGTIPYTVLASEFSQRNVVAENIALNKPVEGTPGIYIQPGDPERYAAKNAVDGDQSTLWGPVGNAPTSGNLIIDLESSQKYNCVKFYGRTNDTVSRTDRIVVLASDDKKDWKEVVSKPCTDSNMAILFDDQVSRYVQIQMVPKDGKIKELSKACEKYGIKLGLYYSLWNRHETYYNDDLVYLEHMKNQLGELLGGEYGELCEIWLDGAWDKSADRWYLPELYDHIKTLQPNCQVGVNQTIGAPNGAVTDPSNYKKYENIKYFPTDFKTWDGKTIADYDEPKIFTYDEQNYYLPYEETVCVRNPFGGFSWFWDNSYNAGDLYPVEAVQQSLKKLNSRGNVFLLNMGIDKTGHMVEDDIATVYKAADSIGIAKGSAIGANQPAAEEEKAELRSLIQECRNIDPTPYTKASVKALLNQADKAEEKLDQEQDLRSADLTAYKNLIQKAKDKLVVIEGNDNLALEKVIAESSPRPYSDAFVPENAVDGDDTTLWGPVDGATGSSITIDLGKEQTFDEICMDGRTSDTVTRVQSYEVYAGNQKNADGSYQLEQIMEGIPCTSAKQIFAFEPVTARYVKIVIHAAGKQVPAYKEISVYNRAGQQPEEADKTLLLKVLEYAETQYASEEFQQVITDVQASFTAALENAHAVVADATATQKAVDSAWKTLMTQIHKLGFIQGDKTNLNDLIELAETFHAQIDKYTPLTAEPFTAALASAKTVLADGNAMQDDVSKEESVLLEAMINLRFKADKGVLESVLDRANEMDTSAYTAESVAVFNEANAKANAVNENPNATQEEVDYAAAELNRAIENLTAVQEAPVPADIEGDANLTAGKGNAKTGETTPVAIALSLLALAGAGFVLSRKKK